MNIALWILAGSLLGWAAYSYLNYNEDRGVKISIAIGAVGGLLGGHLVAPLFAAPGAVSADFSSSALFFAGAAAAALLAAGNLLSRRWGV